MDIFTLPSLLGLSSWPATLAMFASMLIYGFYVKKSAKSKAEELANDAYKKAVDAMQEYNSILEKRIQNEEETARKLQARFDALCKELRAMGLHVDVQGENVYVERKEQC